MGNEVTTVSENDGSPDEVATKIEKMEQQTTDPTQKNALRRASAIAKEESGQGRKSLSPTAITKINKIGTAVRRMSLGSFQENETAVKKYLEAFTRSEYYREWRQAHNEEKFDNEGLLIAITPGPYGEPGVPGYRFSMKRAWEQWKAAQSKKEQAAINAAMQAMDSSGLNSFRPDLDQLESLMANHNNCKSAWKKYIKAEAKSGNVHAMLLVDLKALSKLTVGTPKYEAARKQLRIKYFLTKKEQYEKTYSDGKTRTQTRNVPDAQVSGILIQVGRGKNWEVPGGSPGTDMALSTDPDIAKKYFNSYEKDYQKKIQDLTRYEKNQLLKHFYSTKYWNDYLTEAKKAKLQSEISTVDEELAAKLREEEMAKARNWKKVQQERDELHKANSKVADATPTGEYIEKNPALFAAFRSFIDQKEHGKAGFRADFVGTPGYLGLAGFVQSHPDAAGVTNPATVVKMTELFDKYLDGQYALEEGSSIPQPQNPNYVNIESDNGKAWFIKLKEGRAQQWVGGSDKWMAQWHGAVEEAKKMLFSSSWSVFLKSLEYKAWREGAGKAIVDEATVAKKAGRPEVWRANIGYDDDYGYESYDQFAAGGMDYNYYDQYDAVDGSFAYAGYDRGYYPEQYPMVGMNGGGDMAMQTALMGVLGATMCLIIVVITCIIVGFSGAVLGYVMGKSQIAKKEAVDAIMDEDIRV